ncbi:MAG: hypothetical protein M4579_002291 [Chaenotheca gracillima]|nr:MAG: hypothetical protein M4579_002291 [Chaenotheca gracillima]
MGRPPARLAAEVFGINPLARYAERLQLRHLPPLADGEVNAVQNPFLLLVVTPSFASLLQKSSTFLAEALQQIYPTTEANLGQAQRCSVLAAVVDRLPPAVTRSEIYDTRLENVGSKLDSGTEGVGVVLAEDADKAAPGLFQGLQLGAKAERANSDERRCLSFDIGSEKGANVVEIPLAETIFHNGQVSTMNASYWTRSAQSESWAELGRRIPPSQHVHVEFDASNKGTSRQKPLEPVLGVPLLPLTRARPIYEGFGNIIRKINFDGTKLAGSPASQELEKALAAHFADNGLEAQSASVWALLFPGNKIRQLSPDKSVFTGLGSEKAIAEPEDPRTRVQPGQKFWTDDLHAFLAGGATLHRVLSGGGGWGQKQGLISLDPESRYTTEDPSLSQDPSEGHGINFTKELAVGQLAEPGDWVQFLIPSYTAMPSKSLKEEGSTGTEDGQGAEKDTSLVFDVVPSTLDAMPAAPVDHNQRGRPCYVVLNQFGATSSRGLSYAISPEDSSKPYTTKIDVPYSKMLFNIKA